MPELLVLLGLAALAVLVILRRYGAKRWSDEARTRAADPAGQTFRRVWLQRTPPRAAMGAYRDRLTGTLTTDPIAGHASFVAKDGSTSKLSDIRQVDMGRRGTDFVNTWIEVRYGDDAAPSAVWMNDGRWLGWAALLTHTNRRIADALSILRRPDPTSDCHP